MSEQSIELLKLLDLEPIEVNLFRGISPQTKWPRVYGGQVIGQAMVAACRTVEARLPHSLHAYFILAGDPTVPIIYEVGRLRDGRSFSTRRVTAIQHGQAIFSMIVSFAAKEKDSFDHQEVMPDVPPPEDFSPEKMAGHPLLAAYSGFKSGHALNNKLLRAVFADRSSFEFVTFDDAAQAPAGFAELAPAW